MAEQENTLADTASYDPFTIEPPEQTFERLRKLRATSVIVPPAEGTWYESRYEEARHVLRDAEHFSNAQGFRAHPVGRMMTMRVNVKRDKCIGSGAYVIACPEVFNRDDDGLVVVLDPSPRQELHDAVQEATDACPASVMRTTA